MVFLCPCKAYFSSTLQDAQLGTVMKAYKAKLVRTHMESTWLCVLQWGSIQHSFTKASVGAKSEAPRVRLLS